MRFKILIAGTMAMMAVSADAQVLTFQGVGPVRLGMTVTEAERALGTRLGAAAPPFSNECYVTGRADGKDEALSYVIENAKIVVMTVFLPGDKQPNPNIVDANGVGVGSTEADILRGYKQAKKELHRIFARAKNNWQNLRRSGPCTASPSPNPLHTTGSLRKVRITEEQSYSRPKTEKCFT